MAIYGQFSRFSKPRLPIQKEKKEKWIFFLVATKWTWAHGDGSEGNPQWFGFTNLNPKPFVIVVYMK